MARSIGEIRYAVWAAHRENLTKNSQQNQSLLDRALLVYARFLERRFGPSWRWRVRSDPHALDQEIDAETPEAYQIEPVRAG